ncbi:DUF58 domain-containing protein [Hydrogenovibrio halophilus]|uniref:DUF58 domain-containing protein n=1 Tax=Hydrogenovibrio halophilus TaxID=373391 RepID=UPI000375E4FC|nr:DUF58 domain-containing protein [Hydrogenovibrio halophilus]
MRLWRSLKPFFDQVGSSALSALTGRAKLSQAPQVDPVWPLLSGDDITHLGRALGRLLQTQVPNPKVSAAFKQGEQASRYLGAGMEYEESRLYQPGDEVRRLNWRLMARTGDAYTQLYQEERQESWTLLIDLRQPMRFGTRCHLKATQALRAAGYFAWQAQSDAIPVSAVVLSESVRVSPTWEGSASFEPLMQFASQPCPPMNDEQVRRSPRLYDELIDLQARAQPGDRLILISDFSDLDAATETLLMTLQQKLMIKAIWVQDPSERRLPKVAGLRLRGRDGSVHAVTESLREAYQAWSKDYFAEVQAHLRQAGLAWMALDTCDDLNAMSQSVAGMNATVIGGRP